jgi:methionine-rich copper-binding protein CopC
MSWRLERGGQPVRTSARILTAVVATAALLGLPAVTLGHVELTDSSPAAGENLDTAPSEVTVTFDDELDPDHSSFTVIDADGNEVGSGEVDLTVADRNVLTGSVTITDPGVYTVSYRVAGIDGHPIEGTFSFGYNANEEIPEPTGGEEHPDTALPRPELPLVRIAGWLLIALAALLGARRAAVR